MGKVTIKFFNNACFLVKTPEVNILVDPSLTKAELAAVDFDYVVVSHGHSDHAMNLSEIKVPIYSNEHVAKFKSTDVVIQKAQQFKLADVKVTPVETFNHPTLLQKNIIFDSIMYPFSKVKRCGHNYGFIFQTETHTIYYTSDTMYDKYLFDSIESEFHPDVVLYNEEKTFPLLPKSILSPDEGEQLRWSFTGKTLGMHTPLSNRTVREFHLE